MQLDRGRVRRSGTSPSQRTLDGCGTFDVLRACVCVCAQMYGVFYATSFLDLYRSPRHFSAASLGLTVVVDSGEQYLFLVSPAAAAG